MRQPEPEASLALPGSPIRTQSFELRALAAQLARSGRAYLEFLRVPKLSVGLYRLKPGQIDEQRPHTEDEVYFVIEGAAWFRTAGGDTPVGPGSVLFVQRGTGHHFSDVREDLTVLVFFAPAEHSLKAADQL